MLTQIGFTLVSWLVLVLISTNVVGFFWRGMYASREMLDIAESEQPILAKLAQDHEKTRAQGNMVGLAAIVAFLGALTYFWNWGVAGVAVLLMIARIPDLHWEIRHGRKLQSGDFDRPQFHVLTTTATWISLPLLWAALYRL